MKHHMIIERNCLKKICKNLKTSLTQLKKVKQNTTAHREDHIRQQAEECKLLENIALARHLRNLITIEQQKEVH